MKSVIEIFNGFEVYEVVICIHHSFPQGISVCFACSGYSTFKLKVGGTIVIFSIV